MAIYFKSKINGKVFKLIKKVPKRPFTELRNLAKKLDKEANRKEYV